MRSYIGYTPCSKLLIHVAHKAAANTNSPLVDCFEVCDTYTAYKSRLLSAILFFDYQCNIKSVEYVFLIY